MVARRGGRSVAIETPSLPGLWNTVRAEGLGVAGCAVDDQGLRATDLANEDLVIVTPAHQFPTGAVMSPARRRSLIEWLSEDDGRLALEDDYDAEFRYDRTPVGAVQGLDPSRVIHAGTSSKSLAPGLRLGWITLPVDCVDEIIELKRASDSGSPTIPQLAMADLIASGEYERSVARARHVYRRRRDRLMTALKTSMPRMAIEGAAAGMHLLLRLRADMDDRAVVEEATRRGIRVESASRMELGPVRASGLVLGYGHLPEERIDAAVAALAAVLADVT